MNSRLISKKLSLIIFKHLPVVMAGMMLFHVIMLLLGYHAISNNMFDMIIGYSTLGTIQLFLWSYSLKFCFVHRLMILYSKLVTDCVELQQDLFFGKYITIARVIVMIIGISIFLILMTKGITTCLMK